MTNHNKTSPQQILQNEVTNVATINLDDAFDPKVEELKTALLKADEVIFNCEKNPGSLFEPEFIKAITTIRSLSPRDWARIRVAIKQKRPSGILMSDIDKVTNPSNGGGGRDSSADEMLLILKDNPLYYDTAADKAFIEDTDSGKIYRIGSKDFIEWLSYRYSKENKKLAHESAIKQVSFTLAGKTKHEGIKKKVYLRTSSCDNSIFIFLGDDAWQIIKVTSRGWKNEPGSDVKFWKPGSMAALPMPESGGKIEELWDYLNISGNDKLLVLAWILESFRSETPFPILALNGLQGSAKSSTHSRTRQLTDPNGSNLRAAPKDVQDIYVSAGSNWIVSFENISRLSSQQQDALCTLATGGGFATRTLYTNDDETIINVKRPVIINSIPVVITAQDLTDRVINIELQKLETYRDEIEINAAFEAARPRLFGALLDLLVKTLATLPKVTLAKPPRMADFTRLGEAMAQAMGYEAGTFERIFNKNKSESVSRAMEASPVAVAIREMAENYHCGIVFHGTVKELFDRLTKEQHSLEGWPRSPRGLSDSIRRQIPALESIGVNVVQGGIERIGNQRGISITIKKMVPGNIGNVVSELSTEENNSDDMEVF